MENEGYAINRPPLFKGEKFDYWKQRMIGFFESSHFDMWDVVENGNYIPLDSEGNPTDKRTWSDDQKQRYVLNSKARNILMCALSESKEGPSADPSTP